MRLAMRMSAARMSAVIGLWLVLGLAWAQRVEGDRASAQGMYEAEVPVKGQGAGERAQGFARALTVSGPACRAVKTGRPSPSEKSCRPEIRPVSGLT